MFRAFVRACLCLAGVGLGALLASGVPLLLGEPEDKDRQAAIGFLLHQLILVSLPSVVMFIYCIVTARYDPPKGAAVILCYGIWGFTPSYILIKTAWILHFAQII